MNLPLLNELRELALIESERDRDFLSLLRQAWKDQEMEQLASKVRALGSETWLKSQLQKFKRLASDARLSAEAPQAYGLPFTSIAKAEKQRQWFEFVVDVLATALAGEGSEEEGAFPSATPGISEMGALLGVSVTAPRPEGLTELKVADWRKLKNKVSADLDKAGLDGNKSFESVGKGLQAIGEVLSQHGLEWDETLNAHLFMGDQGRRTLQIAFSTKDDPFSPKPVTYSTMVVAWYKHPSGNYEVTAYLS